MTTQVSSDVLKNDAVLARHLASSALAMFTMVNGYVDWSVSGNVLTAAIKTLAGTDPSATDPVLITFRSPTAASGAPVVRELTAATSIAINNTALLGTTNSTAFKLWCVAFDDGGTVRLGVINCLSGTSIYPLAGWGIASSTQEADGADSAHIFYTDGAAVTSKAYAALGYATWESGLATAGTWSAAPTRAQQYLPGVALPGQIVQRQHTATGAVATGSTVIPIDNSIPQITEGDQYMTQAITPSSASHLLRVATQVCGSIAVAAGAYGMIALFKDAVANALAAGWYFRAAGEDAGGMQQMLMYAALAGSTSAITFRVRAGGNSGTFTFNGQSGTGLMGGVANSFIEAQEIAT